MSNTKTEAQRLADELVHEATKRVCNVAMMPYSLPIDAAKELRRLDAALDAELANRDVLDQMLEQCIAERDQLRAQLAEVERGACAKVCDGMTDKASDAKYELEQTTTGTFTIVRAEIPATVTELESERGLT